MDGVAGLGGFIVQAHCLSRYSHSLPPQPPAQFSLNQGAILWLPLDNANGAATRNYYWKDIPTCTMRNLAWCLFLWCLGQGMPKVLWLLEHMRLRVDP